MQAGGCHALAADVPVAPQLGAYKSNTHWTPASQVTKTIQSAAGGNTAPRVKGTRGQGGSAAEPWLLVAWTGADVGQVVHIYLIKQPVASERHSFRSFACILIAAPQALQVCCQLLTTRASQQSTPQLLVCASFLQVAH